MTNDKPILFDKFPQLEKKVPWMPIGSLPTPVQELSELEISLGHQSLWIKRDDASGDLYGGNKVRKLEFILGDVQEKKKKWILTFGGLGTNHGLATTIYGQKLGLKTVLALIDQPVTTDVRKKLLLFNHYGAKISYAKNKAGAVIKGLWHLVTKRGVYFLGPGGSTELGNLGFVNAALELSKQIKDGTLPQPKRIYVALGSMGTFSGLYLGLKLAGLDTELVGVRVTDLSMTDEVKTAKMINQTSKFLTSLSEEVPRISAKPEELIVRHEYSGPSYGSVTEKALEGLSILQESEGITLETTYTGKAFACMVDDVKSGMTEGEPILFWNTYNSIDLSPISNNLSDFTVLPKSFHKFFSDTHDAE